MYRLINKQNILKEENLNNNKNNGSLSFKVFVAHILKYFLEMKTLNCLLFKNSLLYIFFIFKTLLS